MGFSHHTCPLEQKVIEKVIESITASVSPASAGSYSGQGLLPVSALSVCEWFTGPFSGALQVERLQCNLQPSILLNWGWRAVTCRGKRGAFVLQQKNKKANMTEIKSW